MKTQPSARHLAVILIAAAVIAAATFGAGSGLRPAPATAAGAATQFPQADCSNPAAPAVTFQWAPLLGATVAYLDISLIDNNFQPGTFISSQALAPTTSTVTWPGLKGGAMHVWRLNSLTPNGWQPSETGAFVPCGGPVLLGGPLSCVSPTAASVLFRWAPMSPKGTAVWFDISFDQSFSPGNFAANGPMAPDQTSLNLPSTPAGAWTYFRINELSNGSWYSTIVGSFNAQCGGGGAPAAGGVQAGPVDTNLRGSNERFVLTRLGIDAPVNLRNVGYDAQMGDPAGKDDVVRYQFPISPGLGGEPGVFGTTVVAGHVDYHPNFQAVFWYLRDAVVNDRVQYYIGNQMIEFAIDWVGQIGPDDVVDPYIAASGQETILMITCDGQFNPVTRHYDTRTIVHGYRVL